VVEEEEEEEEEEVVVVYLTLGQIQLIWCPQTSLGVHGAC
jgi:hypothetical protein